MGFTSFVYHVKKVGFTLPFGSCLAEVPALSEIFFQAKTPPPRSAGRWRVNDTLFQPPFPSEKYLKNM